MTQLLEVKGDILELSKSSKTQNNSLISRKAPKSNNKPKTNKDGQDWERLRRIMKDAAS